MSYEKNMLETWSMPSRVEVEKALLAALFRHHGVVKEFASSEELVHAIADEFSLTEAQRTVPMEKMVHPTSSYLAW